MTNPNDPAFPEIERCIEEHVGLTKREWFAGMAMQGLMTNFWKIKDEESANQFPGVVVEAALVAADLMIVELSKSEK